MANINTLFYKKYGNKKSPLYTLLVHNIYYYYITYTLYLRLNVLSLDASVEYP